MNNNTNNQFNGQQGFPKMGAIDPSMLQKFQTESWLKWLLAFIYGMLPMFLFIMIFYTTDDVGSNEWIGANVKIIDVDYGMFWLIGFSGIAITILLNSLSIRFFKEIKADIYPLTIAFSVMLFSIFVIPVGQWWLFLICPIFFFIGFTFGLIIFIIYTILKIRKELMGMQDNLKGMMNNFDPNNFKGPKTNSKKTEYEDNPFIDVKENKK